METDCPPGGTGHCNDGCPFWINGKCCPQEKTVEQARKELKDAIDRENKRSNEALKPYWEALDRAWARGSQTNIKAVKE